MALNTNLIFPFISKKLNLFVLLFLILLKFILQYSVIAPLYELHRDEFLHLDQGKHLAWGYLSVPPVTSWISYLIIALGNSVFWVRFFPALFGALTLVVVWKAIEELKGGIYAKVLAATALIFSALLRLNTLYHPNSLEVLFWSLTYFCILKYINSEKKHWLYLTATALAFGFLNKYNIVFLILGLLPAILLTRHRTVFRKPDLYYAAFLALVIISPNIFWQYQNGFPVIHHMNELAATQLVNVDRLGFLMEQAIFFLTSFFVFIAAFCSFFIYQPFQRYRLFFGSYLFTILLFLYFKGKSYYALGLYPIHIAFGAVYLEHLLKNGWRVYLRPVLICIIGGFFLPFVNVAFPVRTPEEIHMKAETYKKLNLFRWEDGKDHDLPQDFADMLGWKELARIVDSAYLMCRDKEHTLVFCDNYGQAGAVNYYSKIKGMNAVSLNADYINWFPLDKEIRNIVMVKGSYDQDKNREREKEFFESVVKIGEIKNPYARENGAGVYLLLNAKTSINDIFRKEIEERKILNTNMEK